MKQKLKTLNVFPAEYEYVKKRQEACGLTVADYMHAMIEDYDLLKNQARCD